MSHSTSLRAAGSEMVAATLVALLAPPLRRASIALRTSVTSAPEVAGAGPGASGICGTTAFWEVDLLSLDLPVATFFPVRFAALPTDLTVAAGELLAPPRDAAA